MGLFNMANRAEIFKLSSHSFEIWWLIWGMEVKKKKNFSSISLKLCQLVQINTGHHYSMLNDV